MPCPVLNCHAGMLRDYNGRDDVSCPVCDGTITTDEYETLRRVHCVYAGTAEEFDKETGIGEGAL